MTRRHHASDLSGLGVDSIDGLATALAAAVTITGNQTIAGNKTFTGLTRTQDLQVWNNPGDTARVTLYNSNADQTFEFGVGTGGDWSVWDSSHGKGPLRIAENSDDGSIYVYPGGIAIGADEMNMQGNYLYNVHTPVDPPDVTDKQYVDAKVDDDDEYMTWQADANATTSAPSKRATILTLLAFANSINDDMNARTQDDILDGVTNRSYTNTEKSKLSGIASGATANSSDATLLARANHTGSQAASSISDFNTAADARVAAASATGTGSLVRNTTPAITNPTVTNYIETAQTVSNSGSAKTFDLSTGTIIPVTMTANCTFTMPTAGAGKSFMVPIYTGAGAFTGAFTGVKWPGGTAPVLTVTAARMDLASFWSDGTSWYGNIAQNYTP